VTDDPLIVTRNGKDANIAGLWAPNPAFLVCSGPGLESFPLERLRERGVASLGVNNAAARAPVKAWTFSDPHIKFHHALFLDPAVMTFAPEPKLRRTINVRLADGFHPTNVRVSDCPNTYGFDRRTMFVPETFFSTEWAHWGSGKHQPPDVEGSGMLATMLIGVRLLHYLGVRRIYLLGLDHAGRRRRWAKEDRSFERLLPVFERRGVQLVNCNERSGCRVFGYRPFDEAIEDCKGLVPGGMLDVSDWYDKAKIGEHHKANAVCKPKHF